MINSIFKNILLLIIIFVFYFVSSCSRLNSVDTKKKNILQNSIKDIKLSQKQKINKKRKIRIGILMPFSEFNDSKKTNQLNNLAHIFIIVNKYWNKNRSAKSEYYETKIYNSDKSWHGEDKIVYDTLEAKPKRGSLIYDIEKDNIDIIIGPTSISNSLNIRFFTKKHNIPVFSFADLFININLNIEDILSDNKSVFYLNFDNNDQIESLMVSAQEKECKDIYTLLPSEMSDRIINKVKKNKLYYKYNFKKNIPYKIKNLKMDVDNLYKKIKEKANNKKYNTSCILLHESGDRLSYILKLFKNKIDKKDLPLQFIMTPHWNMDYSNALGRNAAIYTKYNMKNIKNIIPHKYLRNIEYVKKFVMIYDLMDIIHDLIEKDNNISREEIYSYLTKEKYFISKIDSAKISFKKNGIVTRIFPIQTIN